MTTRAMTAIGGALLASACGGRSHVFDPAGPAAHDIAILGGILFAVTGLVYVLVLAALGWALWRHRRPREQGAGATRTMTIVVSTAVALTSLTLVAFTAVSVVFGRGLTSPADSLPVAIDVIGHQWWWEFRYQAESPTEVVTSPNELRLPVGTRVSIRAISRDVVHSFWVPNLHGKRDLIPGQTTSTWIEASRVGWLRGQCAEFCGHQHARMRFDVAVETPGAFAAWLDAQRAAAHEPETPAERRGQEVFLRSTCVMCHTIRGTFAASRVGPELTHVGSRASLAAGAIPNTDAMLARWIANPQTIKPGVRMPPNPMASDELQDLVAYLRSLR